MQKLDYSRMNWRRIDPASLVGLSMTIVNVTGIPGLCNAVVLHTATAVFSIEAGNPGLEVYRAERKEVKP